MRKGVTFQRSYLTLAFRAIADRDDLVTDFVSTSAQVIIEDWYLGGELDQIQGGSALLRQNNADTLFAALATYAVPSGSVPQSVQDDLVPTIAATWE